MVEPVDPADGGQLGVLDGPPGLGGFDRLGLVEALDGLAQRIVIGAPDGSDRGLDAGLGEAIGEPDGRI